MKWIETTVACDQTGCVAAITVTGPSPASITGQLADAGWRQLRGLHHYCPNHRTRAAREDTDA